MRVGISGWAGFLATKLRERTDVEWVDSTGNIDCYLHLGGPTFTQEELSEHDAQVMHQYIRESIKMIDRLQVPVILGSTTGVGDIRLDHTGSTSYNLSKLYLENYVLNNCDDSLILRIGTIYSNNINDVLQMKQDRIQPRLLRKDTQGIPFEDHYLNVDIFVNTTINAIINKQKGILTYQLDKLTMPKLMVK